MTRLIRNKVNHYRDNSDEVKTILGPSPHGVYTYFATTFPKLFMSLYSFACIHLRTDPLLERYFPDNVSSEDMGPFCMNSTTSLMVTIAPGYLHQSQEKLNEMEHPSRYVGQSIHLSSVGFGFDCCHNMAPCWS